MATENKINILISAVDEASKVFNKVGGSITEFAKRNEKAFTSMRNVGGIALAGISGYLLTTIDSANESAQATAQLEAVLKSTGNTVGKTKEEIQAYASNLQKTLGISDEVIASGQNMLLTFTNIKGVNFDKATNTIIDMATAMNGGATPSAEALSAQAIQLGKALNNPIEGISALSRVGVAFTDEQKEQIKVLQESGDIMGAQGIILKELGNEFGGSALAQSETFSGSLKKLKLSLGDIGENIGTTLLPALNSIATAIQPVIASIVDWTSKNPELTKYIVLGSLAVAGLVTVLGLLGLAIPVIVAGLGMITAPILAIIAGITVLGIAWTNNFMGIQEITYQVFDEIKVFWGVWGVDIIKGFTNVFENIKTYITIAFEVLSILFTEGFNILGGVFDIFKGLFTGNWSLMWEGIKTVLSSVWNAMKGIITTIATEINTWVKTVFGVDIGATFSDIWNGIKTTAENVFNAIGNFISEKVNWIMNQLRKAKDALLEMATLGGANTSTFNGARAVGGYTSANTPYLVGERGPEIFMPTGSGRIIPNNQMGGGGQSININFGNVTISNGMELNDLTDKIKSVLYNEHKYARLGY